MTGLEIRAIHEAVIERANEFDRQWFEANPARSYRARDALGCEFNEALPAPEDGWSWRVVVAQIGPGIRVRTPITVPDGVDNDDATDEDLERILRANVPDFGQKFAAAIHKRKAQAK